MNLEVIKSKYPKAFEKIKAWGKQQLIGTVGIPSELSDAIPDELLIPSLVNSRSLYDFFDGYKIILIIDSNLKNWGYMTSENSSGYIYNSRIEAEDAGFQKCLEMLEKLLT